MGLLQKRSGGTIYLSGDSLGSSDTLYITSGAGTNTGRAIKILQSNSGAALHVTGTVGSGCFIVDSAYNAHPTLTSSGPAYFNGGNDNSGKADFSVGAGGTPVWSLNGNQFQVGGTDVNWSMRARGGSYGDIGTWDQNFTLYAGQNGGTASHNLALQTATSSSAPTTYVCLCGSDATLYLGTGNIRNAALHNCFIIGGNYTNNAYSSTTGARLLFGGGNDPGNYFIGTNLENYGGNYNKLDIRWHTGIRIGAQAGYGGTRFYNNEDLGCVIFSVGQDNAHIKACNGAIIYGCTCMESPVFYGTSCLSTPTICSSTNSYYLNFNTGNLNIGTGYINSIANSASCFKLIFNNGTGTCICDMTRTPFLAMNGTGDKLCIGGGWFRGGSTASWQAGVLGFNFTASNTTTNTACIPQTHSSCAGYAGIIFGGYDTGLSFYTCCGNTTAGTAVEGPTNAGGGIANKRLQITGNGCVYIDNQLFYNSNNCYYYMTNSLSVSQAGDCQGIAIGCTYANIGSWHTQLSLYGTNHSVTRWNHGAGTNSADNAQCNCIYAHTGNPFVICSSGNIRLKPGTGTVCVCGDVCMPINQHTTYGPNSTWGAYLRVGGNGNTVQGCNSCLWASVVATDGNLHLDAGVGKGLYLNFYDGSYIYFGSGSNSNVGCVTSACLYHSAVICGNNLRAAANMCTPLLYLTGVNTPIICGPAGHFVISTDSNCSMVGTTYSTRCFAFNGSCFKQTCELINSNCVQSPILCATSCVQGACLHSTGNICGTEFCSSGWFRSTGTGGIYFASYGGGWHMTDSTWIRSYNNKCVYINCTLRVDGLLHSLHTGTLLKQTCLGNRLTVSTSGNMSCNADGWHPAAEICTAHSAHSLYIKHNPTGYWAVGANTCGYGVSLNQCTGANAGLAALMVCSGGAQKACIRFDGQIYSQSCVQSPVVCGTSCIQSGIISGCLASTSGDGQNNLPFRLASDYNSFMVAAAGCNWGLFWAGNSGARYGTNGRGGPGNIWGNSGNPNEFVFVGADCTDWTVHGGTGRTWQRGGATICNYAHTCQFKTNSILSPGSGNNSCTGSGYVIGTHAVIPGTGWSCSGSSTGRIEIGLPTLDGEGGSTHLGMVHVVVDVYEYNSNAATTYILGGHNWNCAWYNCSANRAAGCNPKGIKLAYHSCGGTNNGRYVILIGEPGDTWSYGAVFVRRISNGLYYCDNMNMGTNMYIKQVTCADSYYNCTTSDLTTFGTTRAGNIYSTGQVCSGRLYATATGTCSIVSAGGICVTSDWYRISGGGGLYFSSYTAGIHGGGTGVVCAYNNGSFCSNASTGWGLRSEGCILAVSCVQANVNVCAVNNLVSGNATYVGEWVRFNSNTRGLYWNGNCGLHLYPASENTPYMYLRSNHSNTALVITTSSNTTARGYLYGDVNNNIGILDSDGHWAIRHIRDNCTEFRINNGIKATIFSTCFCSNNIVCAATCLSAPTVCATGCVTAPTVYSNGANMTAMAAGCCNWCAFMVCGDADTFYPVCYFRGYTYGYKRYAISRHYSNAAPNTWYSSTHKGGLNYTWEQTSDTQWGGNDRTFRINSVCETYSAQLGGHIHTVSGGLVLLRGGGAYYVFWSDAGCCNTVCVYDGAGGTDSQGQPHSTCTYFIPGNCACVCALTCANALTCRNNTICNPSSYPLRQAGTGNGTVTDGCLRNLYANGVICTSSNVCGNYICGFNCVQTPYILATNCVHACCGITFTHSNWSGEKTKIQAHSTHLYFQNYNTGSFIFRNCSGGTAASIDQSGCLYAASIICSNSGITASSYVRSPGYLQTGDIIYPWSQACNCVRFAVGNAAGNGWIDAMLICKGGNVEFPISGYNVVKCCGNIIACQGSVIAMPNSFSAFHTPFCAEYGYNAVGTAAWRLYIGGSYVMQQGYGCDGCTGYLLYAYAAGGGGKFKVYNGSNACSVTICGQTGAVCATCFVGDGSNLTGVGGGTETSCTHSSYSGTTGITLDITHKTHVLPLASGAVITGFTYSNRSSSGTVDTITLVVKYSGTASITWTNVVWSGGVTPTLTGTSGKADVFVLTSYNGSYWVGTIAATNLDSTNL